MKKELLLSILGMAAVSAWGQGAIKLDNYNTYGPYITYGPHYGSLFGTGVGADWTMGVYYWNAVGNFVASTSSDITGLALPSTLGNYVLGTGLGSTATFQTSAGGQAGAALANTAWHVPGTSASGGDTITLIIVAYRGATYTSATDRSHSAAFTLVTLDTSSPSTITTGTAMPGFSINWIPEPSTLALAGLIGAAWLLFRHRRA